MDCHEAQPFVSALHDMETVPPEAAEHIRGCPACKERLREYAQMGAELRLLASATPEEAAPSLPVLPERRGRWVHTLTARVLVPRFALALGVFAILGFSVGFGLMRAQASGPWFQFDVISLGTKGSWGSVLQGGDSEVSGFLPADANARIASQVKVLEVRKDVVRLKVRACRFEPGIQDQGGSKSSAIWPREAEQVLGNTPYQEFQYVPGQTLEVPVEGGSKILVKGQVFELRPSFSAEWYSVTPKADEIVLSKSALVRDQKLLGEVEGSASAEAANSAIAIYVPEAGIFVFALKPFEGAVAGVAEFGQAHFKMDGQDYILFSATPITGGQQPREIWVYRRPNCPRSWVPPPKTPMMIGAGDVSNVLDGLRK